MCVSDRVCSSIPQWCLCYPYQGHTASCEWQSLAVKRLLGPGPVCVCECVWKRCRLVFVCTSMPSLDQRCAWLYRHSSPLMTGTRQSGKALWRHRRVGSSGSSSQDDRKAMALINGLSLVSQAFDNHYSTASCVLNQSQQPWKGQQSRVTLAEKCWKDCHQESRRLTGSVAGFHFFFGKVAFIHMTRHVLASF